MIYHSLGKDSDARDFLSRALKTNPHFQVLQAPVASRTLEETPNRVRGFEVKTMHKHTDRGHHRRLRTILFLFVLILSGANSFAHPMGNFSVNHYSKVTIQPGSVEVFYLIDMAEIPTFQETRQFAISRAVDDPQASGYLDRQEELLKEGLCLLSDGQPVRLDTQSRHLTPGGAGGLPTMKLGSCSGADLSSPRVITGSLTPITIFPGGQAGKRS